MIYTLYWTAEDGQASVDMGEFPTKEAAEKNIATAKAELLDQCGDNEHRDAIEAGSWSVDVCTGE